MAKRDDLGILIATHKRPDNVITLQTLEERGYTGPWRLLVDDQDPTLPDYIERYGDQVITFSKPEVGETFDRGTNARDYRGVVYARNVGWQVARDLGWKYFGQFDDDYRRFHGRITRNNQFVHSEVRDLDEVFCAMIDFLEATPHLHCIALPQDGDLIGGRRSTIMRLGWKRKAMNAMFVDVDAPFEYPGPVNEDCTVYGLHQRSGDRIFLTLSPIALNQLPTQVQGGGASDLYIDGGTYYKLFASVMHCPSAIAVRMLHTSNQRIHHFVSYKHCAPCIVREDVRKPRSG